MSETIGAVDVWEDTKGGKDFSRIEISKVTVRNGKHAGNTYLRAYGVYEGGKRRAVKNIYKNEEEGLEVATNAYLEGWKHKADEYDDYKATFETDDVSQAERLAVETEDYDRVSGWRRLLYRPAIFAGNVVSSATVKLEQLKNGSEAEIRHRRVRASAVVAGGLVMIGAVAGAAWLARRGDDSWVRAFSENNPALDNIADNINDQLDGLADSLVDARQDLEIDIANERIDELTERIDLLEGLPDSASSESGIESPVVPNHGPLEGPEVYDGSNVQVINVEAGQSNFAVSLPDGWSVDNVEGQQVMYDAQGRNILQVGQEVTIKGKKEVLESFMDRQGNISKQGREVLRSMGYDLAQGQYEFKRPNGTTGLHFMTVVRTT